MDVFIQPILEDFPTITPFDNFGIFGGRIQRSSLSGFEAYMMDLVGFEDNDSRNFAKVANWSKEIALLIIGDK